METMCIESKNIAQISDIKILGLAPILKNLIIFDEITQEHHEKAL